MKRLLLLPLALLAFPASASGLTLNEGRNVDRHFWHLWHTYERQCRVVFTREVTCRNRIRIKITTEGRTTTSSFRTFDRIIARNHKVLVIVDEAETAPVEIVRIENQPTTKGE